MLIVVAMKTIIESLTTTRAIANGLTKPMEDESDVLTLEVVLKVDAN